MASRLLSSCARDLREALRSARTNRAFSAMTLCSLALSMALGITMAGVLDAIVHPPSPFRDANQLVRVDFRTAGADRTELVERLLNSPRFAVATYRSAPGMSIGAGGERQSIEASIVSPNYFALLGTRFVVGRAFDRGHGASASQVVLSERTWRRINDGHDLTAGQRVAIDDEIRVIVGVVPDAVAIATGVDLWLPERVPAPATYRSLVARLNGAASLLTVRRQILATIQVAAPPESAPIDVQVRPFNRDPLRVRDYHYALSGAVGCVILIACANIAALLLARGPVQRREFAVRMALGATRGDLVRKMLIECGGLAILGGLVGVVMASWAIAAIGHHMSTAIRESLGVPQFNWRVGTGGFAAVAGTMLLVALWPAYVAANADAADGLKDGANTATTRASRRFTYLVVTEFAASMVLLVAAGLLARTIYRVSHFDFGYDMGNLVSFQPMPANAMDRLRRAADRRDVVSRAQVLAEWSVVSRAVLDAVGRSPNVEAASFSLSRRTPDGLVTSDVGEAIKADYRNVSPGFFRTFGIKITAGRDFAATDQVNPGKAIIDESVARQLWRGASPIGRLLKVGGPRTAERWVQVVGLVKPVYFTLPSEFDADAPGLVAIVDASSATDPVGPIITRGKANTPAFASRLLATARAAAPGAQFTAIEPWSESFRPVIDRQRFFGTIFVSFGIAGVALAAIGLFGVVAYTVLQRQREFAIRLAMGATSKHIVELVIRFGAVMILGGTAVGAFIAMWGARFSESLLYGVYGIDPMTLIGAELVLFIVGALACWIPARRAMKMSPLDALRAS